MFLTCNSSESEHYKIIILTPYNIKITINKCKVVYETCCIGFSSTFVCIHDVEHLDTWLYSSKGVGETITALLFFVLIVFSITHQF